MPPLQVNHRIMSQRPGHRGGFEIPCKPDGLTGAMETGVEIIANPLDLVPVVARARTVVVPQVWGTSSKLKMAAALASGRRVVASPTATVELSDALANYVAIAESVDEWHRHMDSDTTAPRSSEETDHLIELMSASLSWPASANSSPRSKRSWTHDGE